MSTEYYGLKEPVTRLRREERGDHVMLTVFVNHANTGELTLDDGESYGFLLLFAGDDVLLHTSAGPDGKVLCSYDTSLDPKTQLISEYGDLTTLEEITKWK